MIKLKIYKLKHLSQTGQEIFSWVLLVAFLTVKLQKILHKLVFNRIQAFIIYPTQSTKEYCSEVNIFQQKCI